MPSVFIRVADELGPLRHTNFQRPAGASTHGTARERNIHRNPIADGKEPEREQTAHQRLCVTAEVFVNAALVLVPEEDTRTVVPTRKDCAVALLIMSHYDRRIGKIVGVSVSTPI